MRFGKAAAWLAAAVMAVSSSSLGETYSLRVTAADTTRFGMITGGEKYIFDNYEGALNELIAGVLEHRSKIDLSAYNIYDDAKGLFFKKFINAARASSPEMFLAMSFRGVENYSDYKVLYVVPTYAANKAEGEAMMKEVRAAADRYLARLEEYVPNGSEFDKAIFLHDELVMDLHYAYLSSDLVDEETPNYGIYTALIKKKGSCHCYSRVYAYLLAQVGIKSEIIGSDEMDHEWVKVCLDGIYYNVDITWDDSAGVDKIKHTYFLLSDDALKLDYGTGGHTDFHPINASNDTSYDLKGLHNFTSRAAFADGKLYAVDQSVRKLVRYDVKRNYEETIVDLSGYNWVNSAGNPYVYNYSWVDSYHDMLFYNTPDNIYMIDPETMQTTEIYARGRLYQFCGVRIRDGRLYGLCAAKPSAMSAEVDIGKLCAVSFDTAGGEKLKDRVLLSGMTLNDVGGLPVPEREGYRFKGWKLKNSDYDGSQRVTGDIELKAEWVSVRNVVKDTVFSRENGISLEMSFEPAEDLDTENAYFLVKTFDSEQKIALSDTKNNNSIYKIHLPVYAAHLDDEMKISLYDGGKRCSLYDSEGKAAEEYPCKAAEYVSKAQKSKDRGEAAFAKAFADYGAKAAAYFSDGGTGSEPDESDKPDEPDKSDEDGSDGSEGGYGEFVMTERGGEDLPAEEKLCSWSLMLERDDSVRLYFRELPGEFTVTDKATGKKAAYRTGGSMGFEYIEIPPAGLTDPEQMFTITFDSGYEIEAGAMSYIGKVLEENTDSGLCKLVKDYLDFTNAVKKL